ncbi:MAG: rhomboid family intramembrane serine protease [Bdellovibrionota bacterium]
MIFPTPEIFRKWMDYPMTFSLLIVNVITFFTFFFDQAGMGVETDLLEDSNLVYTGQLYLKFIQTDKMNHHLSRWSQTQNPTSTSQMKSLGNLALKDTQFIAAAANIEINGDQIFARKWRQQMHSFSESYQKENLFILGLSAKSESPTAWLTYQFSHATVYHLFSNCVFLFFLGCVIEKLLGSYIMISIYLLGGVVGGFSYLWTNPQSFVPMVGASASISALLCFYGLYEARRRIRYFYFLSPLVGHNGYIYLSPLLIFPLFLVSDISSILSAPIGAGASIAYSAHIGGAVVGLVFAVLFRWVLRIKKASLKTC